MAGGGTPSCFSCASTPRPAARTSQSRHAIPTPASCGLGFGKPDGGRLFLARPCGPRELRTTGGILPPSAPARWTIREPGLLARLPSNSARTRSCADVTSRVLQICELPRSAHRSIRLPELRAPPARMPAERWSVARPMSPQDAGGRRAIRRPGGPPKNKPATVRTSTRAARTKRASNWRVGTTKCEPQDAASMRHTLRLT